LAPQRTDSDVAEHRHATANQSKCRMCLTDWEWTYDALNRLTGRAEPPIDIDDPNYGPLTTTWYYDDNGNLTRLVGPDGGQIGQEHDELDRLVCAVCRCAERPERLIGDGHARGHVGHHPVRDVTASSEAAYHPIDAVAGVETGVIGRSEPL